MDIEIDFKKLIAWARTTSLALRAIAIVIAVDLVVILFALMSLEDDVDARAQRVFDLHHQLSDIDKKIRSTRAEIDRLPELRKQYDKAIKDGVLADQDRSKFVDLAKSLADQDHLADFHFRLSPETIEALPGNKFELVSTDVDLNNGALTDSEVFAFWDEFLVTSQAHYEVTRATIAFTTTPASSAAQMIRSGQHPVLVKADLQFHWQSMRRVRQAAKTAQAAVPRVVPRRQAP